MRRGVLILCLCLCVLSMSCAINQDGDAVLRSAIEKWQSVKSYQLEAELEVNGEVFCIKQWFLSPNMVRSVITQGSRLEYVLLTTTTGSSVYNAAIDEWSTVTDDNSYSTFASYSLPDLMELLAESAGGLSVTHSVSTIKLSGRETGNWDYGEVILCRKSLAPEKIVLVNKDVDIVLTVRSLVGNLNLAPDMFSSGQ